LADWEWHQQLFNFVGDPVLRDRLADEFMSTRYIYKVLEGIEADEWLQRAQIRIQILSYASIYEAVVHHLLFSLLSSTPEVQSLKEYPKLKRISIPAPKRRQLAEALSHSGKEVITTYQGTGRQDETKVRFDAKVACAVDLGLLDSTLGQEIIDIYEARNAIHIHAEIRKSLDYQLDLSRKAYRRMEPFLNQVKDNLASVLQPEESQDS